MLYDLVSESVALVYILRKTKLQSFDSCQLMGRERLIKGGCMEKEGISPYLPGASVF